MPLPEHLERLARDCDVTPFRSSGPGGQKKNKTESSVRAHHRPSGLTRIATEHRSQSRNRQLALERVWEALEKRRRKPKPRKPTRPTRASVRVRIEDKRRISAKKRARGQPGDD
jgi:protein subunit release factor B